MSTDSARPAEFEELARELILARATDLARAGHYGDAEQLLADKTSAAAFDLRARILAQQGRLAEADECWARAAEVGGEGAGYHAERHRIAALQRRRLGTWWMPRRVGFGLLATALAVGVVLLWVPGAADMAALRAQQNQISSQLGAIASRLAGSPAAGVGDAELMSPIAAELSAPTLLVSPAPTGLTVTFPVAPFTGTSARLTPEGEATLTDLGRRLARHAGKVSIRVVGHTNDVATQPGGQYPENIELGLSRALAAMQQLSASSGIPPSGFAVASAGADTPPFPNTSAENRAKNRTVTIEITPARG